MAARILFLAIPIVLMSAPAMAETQLKAVLDGEAAVSDDDLADMRAGFFTAAGAQFDFGASIKTMVNGQLALQTSLQWTQAGAVTQQLAGLGQSIANQVNNQVASNLAAAGVPPAATNAVTNGINQAANAANDAVQTVNAVNPPAAADTQATPPAPGPNVAVTNGPAVTGVAVPGTGGTTQVMANLAPNQIQNIIMNSASGQTISQDTNITFTIYNFQAWQQQLAEHTISARLASDMLAASGFAAGH
jgi:hypothetical protein